MASFKSCQIYHLDSELPGACKGYYWPIHLASFSLAIQTTNNVILIALLCAAVLRLITATLVPSIIATGRPGGESLSSALQNMSPSFMAKTLFPWLLISSCSWIFYLKKNSSVWMLLDLACQVFSGCLFYSTVGSNALAGNKEECFPFFMPSLLFISKNSEGS